MVRFLIISLLVLIATFPISAQDDSNSAFTVIVNSNANLRSCAGTQCEIAGRAAAGDVLQVLEIEDDWYQVRTEDGDVAYIATFLTTRGPDDILELEEWYVDEGTGCDILVEPSRGSMAMYIIIAGDNQDEVTVDLFRPNETHELSVQGQLLKEFIDAEGELYIHQYYGWNIGWPFGMYNLEYTIDDITRRLGFEVEERGEYRIRVYCGYDWNE